MCRRVREGDSAIRDRFWVLNTWENNFAGGKRHDQPLNKTFWVRFRSEILNLFLGLKLTAILVCGCLNLFTMFTK